MIFEEALPSALADESMEQCPFPITLADEANLVAKSTDSTKMHVPAPTFGTLLIRDILVVADASAVVWYASPIDDVVWVQRN